MFEFDKYDKGLHKGDPATPDATYEPASDVAGISFLHWGEHCVECAAPVCYQSCDLYQPRSDNRCRRFAFGAYKNLAFPSLRGYGVEVSFKKWAKIEAFGDSSIHPVETVIRWERMVERGAPIAGKVGRLVNRATGSRRWNELSYIASEKLTRMLHRRGIEGSQPQAFLLEVYNPGERQVRLQIIFSVAADDVISDGKQVPMIPPAIRTVSLPSGYSRHEFPASEFQQIVSQGVPFKITMVPEADDNARLVFLTADLVRFKNRAPASPTQRKIKCVIWDLDGTLWDGNLVEGDDVRLKPGVAELLRHLDERGILLSVVSKNDYAPAWEKLKQLRVADYFLYPQIDWLPKGEKVRTIAKQLNLGLDTFAFIDDNPFELAEVSSTVPELICIPAEEIELLRTDPQFQGSVTEESRNRRKMYKEQASREQEEQKFGGAYMAFLASCELVLEVDSYTEADRERVTELVQRTNQLNFSGRKYSRDELEKILANPTLGKYVLRCSDKYGSYGTVGFCLVWNAPEMVEIVDFMLSCRVQSKFIEQALFSHLLEHHNPNDAKALWVNFRKTERNTPAHNVLQAIGFRPAKELGEGFEQGVILRISEPLKCDFIAVRCSAQQRPANLTHAEKESEASDGSAD